MLAIPPGRDASRRRGIMQKVAVDHLHHRGVRWGAVEHRESIPCVAVADDRVVVDEVVQRGLEALCTESRRINAGVVLPCARARGHPPRWRSPLPLSGRWCRKVDNSCEGISLGVNRSQLYPLRNPRHRITWRMGSSRRACSPADSFRRNRLACRPIRDGRSPLATALRCRPRSSRHVARLEVLRRGAGDYGCGPRDMTKGARRARAGERQTEKESDQQGVSIVIRTAYGRIYVVTVARRR